METGTYNQLLLLPIFLLGFLSGSMDFIRTQTIGLLGLGISPVGRPLSTKDNTRAKGRRTDIHLFSWIRIHDPNV
jgi:hypothetical protein